jgi:hypothetical protein
MDKLTPRLPLLKNTAQAGFELIVEGEVKDLIKQNLKMIILTNPGERVMMPDFGVGIMQLLFENYHDTETTSYFKGRIIEQIDTYLPSIIMESVDFFDSEVDANKISIRIHYSIPALGEEDVLEILQDKRRGKI